MILDVPILGQRDSRWASILLGYNTSTYTIGSHGCLVTSLSMLIGKTPDQVNQILKDNGGFLAGGGLFIWGKASVLGLTCQYTSSSYSGPVTDLGVTKAKEYLDQGFPLIAEVDFNPATVAEEQHYVVVVGYDGEDFIMNDPWTKDRVSMDKYGGFRRAIVQFRVYDKRFQETTLNPTVQVDSKVFENLVRKSTAWDNVYKKLNVSDSETIVQANLDKMIGYEDIIGQRDKALSDAQSKLTDLKNQLDALSSENEQLKTTLNDIKVGLNQKVSDLQAQLNTRDTQILDLSSKIKGLQDSCKPQPVFTGWKLKVYNFLKGK